jgi:hypothetical protein
MSFLRYIFKRVLSMFGFKFCEYCGGVLRGDAKKCSDCGSPVRDSDVWSWGWCAIGAMLFPVGLIAALVFACKRKRNKARSAFNGALIQILLVAAAVGLFLFMQNQGIALF